MKPTQALRTLTGAIDADQMPERTHLEMGHGYIKVTLPITSYRQNGFADHETWADRVRLMFPGGNNRRMFVQHRGEKRRRVPASDRADYRVFLGDTLIILEYIVPHEHRAYRGEAVDGGKPKWTCTGCRQPITITEARRLGLLPPRATKAAAK